MKGPTIPEGTIVKGKYRVERRLGVGGMGIVVAAMHLKLEQRVAIKFLLPEMLLHPEIVDRFLKEARAASRIEGDHVARVMDVDVLEDGSPFLVMEYLEGRDLSWVRKSRQPLHTHDAVRYVLEACSAIAEAHHMGIVHRDLKPANLFLAQRRDGSTRVKVLDFGISKLVGGPGDIGSTKTGAVLGSAEYMSPEQILASRDVDPRSDIWSLGIVLYELCTARLPFRGDSITHVAVLVAGSEPVPASQIVPTIPAGLEAIMRRCLEKDRERRFQSIAELTRALAPFAQPMVHPQGPPIVAPAFAAVGSGAYGNTPPPITPAPALTAPSTIAGVSTGSRGRASATPKRAQIFAIAGAALLGLVAGVLILFRLLSSAPSPAATSSAAPHVASAAPAMSESPAASAAEAPRPSAEASASGASSSAPAVSATVRPASPGVKPKSPLPAPLGKHPAVTGID